MVVLLVYGAPGSETLVLAAGTVLSQRRSWWRSLVYPAS